MKKGIILIFVFTAGRIVSQEQQQWLPQQNFSRANTLNNNGNNLNVQQRTNPVYASNINLNNVKVNTVKANPATVNSNNANVKPITTINVPRRTVQQRHRVRTNNSANVESNTEINNENNIQDFLNIANPAIQDNTGNQFILINDGNINIDVQGNKMEIPQIQAAAPKTQMDGGNIGGNGASLSFNMPKINMPSIKLKAVKFSGGSSHSSHHKKFNLKNRLIKLDRKLHAKFSGKKKLRIKVDNCFKW